MEKRVKRRKLGRNDLCWCRSGLKYKNCHLNREKELPPDRQKIWTGIKKNFGKEYCLHPQASKSTCSPKIIKAHTLQRNGGLSRIARNGCVYQLKFPDSGFTEIDMEDDLPQPVLVGVKAASTFTGFCGFHDSITFEPIEQHFFQSIPQHTFLLGYRAICMQLFVTKAWVESASLASRLDSGMTEQKQRNYQLNHNIAKAGYELALLDAKLHKSQYDNVLISSDYDCVNYYVVRLQNVPEVMCANATMPLYDFHGNGLQWFENLRQIEKAFDKSFGPSELITFSLIATD
jgi:hypothetical protein